VTRNPTAEWLARQITEAFPWDSAPKYLIRDNDRAFGVVFKARVPILGGLHHRYAGIRTSRRSRLESMETVLSLFMVIFDAAGNSRDFTHSAPGHYQRIEATFLVRGLPVAW
jgi:hypothetical protein